MRSIASAAVLLAGLGTAVSATGILLPLYLYPSNNDADCAELWQPAITAIGQYPKVSWQVVVDPGDGPGTYGPGYDSNYELGITELNAQPNVRTIGYVHVLWGTAPIAEVKKNVTLWAKWGKANANWAVQGIFFDETTTSNNKANLTYLGTLVQFAKTQFAPAKIVTICNFGERAPVEYYSICDELVVYEDSLGNYKNAATIAANIPKGANKSQAAVIVYPFSGTGATIQTLKTYAKTLKQAGVGWGYFSTGGYQDLTTGVGNVSNNALAFAKS